MSKITIEELSASLKDRLKGAGLQEDEVIALIEEMAVNVTDYTGDEDIKINSLTGITSIDYTDGTDIKIEESEGADIDLSDYQQKTDTKLQTSSKELVGAINELFQNANNGKELIASAIGEPLNSEDTFSAMSNDINGLLSTFKTNMMKNGVTVESGDKFKSLIDKIANGNDGDTYKTYILNAPDYYKENFYENFSISTKYNSMTVNLPSVTPKDTVNNGCLVINSGKSSTNSASVWSNTAFYNLSTSIDLTNATKFLITAKRTQGTQIAQFGLITIASGPDNNGRLTFTKSIDIATSSEFVTYEMDLSDVIDKHYIAIALQTSGMRYIDPATIVHVSQIAIEGIKENDALRDSLADILENKGVEVSPEDDMADLITKVDSISSGGLDIIAATELPNTIVNNQIVMLTDTTPSSIGVVSFDLCNPAEGELNVCTTQLDSSNIFTFESNGINVSLPLTNSYQMINGLKTPIAGYYGVNNTWVQFSNGYYPMFENGTYLYDELFGTMKVSSGGSLSITDNNIFAKGTMGAFSVDMINTKAIDLSKFERVEMTVSISGSGYFYFAVCPSTNFSTSNAHTYVAIQSGTYSLDLSSLNGTGYIGIDSTNNSQGTMSITISKIVFY